MNNKFWLVLIPIAVVLGIFLFLKHMERGIQVPVSPPAPARPPSPQQSSPTTTGPAIPTPAIPMLRLPESEIFDLETCTKTTTLQDMPDLLSKRGMPGNHANVPEKLMKYSACEAWTHGDVSGCDVFARWTSQEGSSRLLDCRQAYFNMMFLQSAARGDPDVVGKCVQASSITTGLSKEAVTQLCNLMVERIRERKPGDICQRLFGLLKPKISLKEFVEPCNDGMAYIEGPEACEKIGRSEVRQYCLFYAELMAVSSKGGEVKGLCNKLGAGVVGDYCKDLVDYNVKARKEQLAIEVDFRKTNNLPGWKEGDLYLSLLPVDERAKYEHDLSKENSFRAANSQPKWKEGDLYLSILPDAERAKYEYDTNRENAFRAANNLPKWKKGNPFLYRLPDEERKKYEWNPADQSAPKKKSGN